MPRFRSIIARGKEATERQKERLYEQRTKLIEKYIKWEPEKKRYLFLREDVQRFCTELIKLEDEREDLKDILTALNRVISFLHDRTNSELKLEKITQLAEEEHHSTHSTDCLCGDCCELAKRNLEMEEFNKRHAGEIRHQPNCSPYCLGECVKEN